MIRNRGGLNHSATSRKCFYSAITNKIIRRDSRARTSLVDVDGRESTITRASPYNINPVATRGWILSTKKIDMNNKQSVASLYGNYVKSRRTRVRLLLPSSPSVDHIMIYTLHMIYERLSGWIYRAFQNLYISFIYLFSKKN